MESGHVSGTDINKNQAASLISENSHVSPGEIIQLGSTGRPSDGSAPAQIPPTPAAAMEQPDESSPLSNSDRIPSHVFATTTATSPAEWSVASNESLFSIHVGNTSFSKDQLSWMSKSGELGYNSDSTIISSPLMDLPSNQTPRTRQKTEVTKKRGNLNEDRFGVTEDAEAMREVLREKEYQQKDNIAKESSPHSRSVSQHSDASVKSFAFPILTADADKCGSSRNSTKSKKLVSQPSTIPKETPDIPLETPKPPAAQETPNLETPNPKSNTQKPTQNACLKRWLSCFSCCPSCSCSTGR